jgi:adenine-specific DNA-methyltransferase
MAKSARTAKNKASGKAEVETYKHEEAKRKNIPTAENQKLIADDDKAIKKLRWPRNPDLDPQLVWRGKEVEPDPLEVDAPPIYIQEKIKPQAIIEDLRRQTRERANDAASQFDFFHDFNGLPEGWKEDATASYYHDEGNWSNRMILGDSLLVMASLAEREGLRGKVQCIYMDPPYGIRFNSNWQPSTKSRDVRDGNEKSISREPEVIRAFRDTWKDGIHSFLSYARDRLVAARELLDHRGSIFVQIGDENVQLLRSLMDEVFGEANFVSQISFLKTTSATSEFLPSVSDYVLWFAKDIDHVKYRPLFRLKQIGGLGSSHYSGVLLDDGRRRTATASEREGIEPLPMGAVFFTPDQLQSAGMGREKGEGAASWFTVDFAGQKYTPTAQSRWKTNEVGMARLVRSSRVVGQKTALRYLRKIEDFSAFAINNVWTDVGGAAEKRYVVETAPKIVERCVLMTTDPGDLVLDPTCGSGTTAYVAEEWGRRWITIDTSRVALTLARARLMGAKYDYYLLKDSKDGGAKEGEITGKPATDGPFTNNIRHGFVFERVPHVRLKSIADNAEIDVIWERWQKTLEPLFEKLNKELKQAWGEWQIPRDADDNWPAEGKAIHAQWWDARRARQKEIDVSIARNADIEYLYDRPYKARGVVRVAGPFTVESLSPHRVLPMTRD